ncbi:hypothetical protein [Flavobacterium sp.]|jgi:hypothetical protein|uniref:hypothetical protein n=1 Tax=Flavobacterium sp. TaxID=239 RepID=UPI0037BE28FC
MDIVLERREARRFMILCLLKNIKAEYTKIEPVASIKSKQLFVVIRVENLRDIDFFDLGAYWQGVKCGTFKLPEVKTLEPFDSFIKYQMRKHELRLSIAGEHS